MQLSWQSMQDTSATPHKHTHYLVGPAHHPHLLRMEPQSSTTEQGVKGQIVLIDRFGNLVTNIREDELASMSSDIVVAFEGHALPLSTTYGDVALGAPIALIGSEGWLEIAVRDGSAHELLKSGLTTPVVASPKAPS